MFCISSQFTAIPLELEEAALLNGCTSFTMLYRVMLTLVSPGIVTAAIYTFINAWNEFLAALIFMSDQDKFTVPVLLSNVQSGLFGLDWGALQAGVTVAIIPSAQIFLLLQRYYLQGSMGGAIQG